MKSLVNALDNFNKKKILVIGDIILDKFTWGIIDSLNPEMPAAPKVKIKPLATYALGGAANVANNIVSLNAKCYLYGAIGNDKEGEEIINLCKKRGINLTKVYHGQTIMKERVMAHRQQIVRLEYGEWQLKKIGEDIQKKVIKNLEKDLYECDFIILSDYDKTFFNEEFSQKVIKLANSKKIPTLVDTKPSNLNYFKDCYIICPNKKEAEIMTGIKYDNGKDRLIEMGKKLSEMSNSRYSIITCGQDGVFSYDNKTGDSLMIKTKAKGVADVTGAGDTFAATLALGLSSQLNITQAVELANYSSGVVVEKVGTATPTIKEIKKKIKLDMRNNNKL